MKRILFALVLALTLPAHAGLKAVSNGLASGTLPSTAFPLLAPDGTNSAPSYAFSAVPGTGFYRLATRPAISVAGTLDVSFASGGGGMVLGSTGAIGWTSSDASAGTDTTLLRDGAPGAIGLQSGVTPTAQNWYFTTTGPVKFGITTRANGAVFTATGGAAQISYAQTTAPTCTTNCGTPGNTVAGNDSAGLITMGTTPASGFVVVFNGTWPSAPSCIVQSALTSMVTGKKPIAVQVTTGQFTVTTDGTAPVAADQYQYQCTGRS